MTQVLCEMKNMELLQEPITLKSALAPGQEKELEELAQVLAASVKGEASTPVQEPGGGQAQGLCM